MNADQKKRYLPQIRMEEIGESGQQRLSESKVLIVGCGALGSPVAMYLAGAGIDTLYLADFDCVDLSNLHRQVFYEETVLGKKKVECLAERIARLNSQVSIQICDKLLTRRLLDDADIIDYDMIVDAADNPATTYMLSDFCQKHNIPLSTAGIRGWNAQIFTYLPGSSSYRDIFPEPTGNEGVLPCSIAGITGPTAAFAASIQAAETINSLLGYMKSSRLLVANLLNMEFSVLNT